MQKIVLASSNPGKLSEFSELLKDFAMEVRPQSEFGVEDADETGLTFIENAILKARHACEATSLPAISDDSGLEVDALDGAPGIYSARFAAMHDREPGDQNNNTLLLEKLKDIKPADRTARFRSVIVLMRHATDPAPIVAEGIWQGSILLEPSGTHGFGYDPLFLAPETSTSSAMLDKQKKNTLSHRGKALKSLISQLESLHKPLTA